MEQDTIKLLRECDSGVKMGVDSINDVLQSTRSPELKKLLTDCRNQHEILGDEISRKLCSACEPGKQTPACAKGLAWIKTNVKLAVNESDSTVADLITDGCNLGVKSLRLLTNNPDKVYQLSEFGMEIKERVPIQMSATAYDLFYLRTKQNRMGHILKY